MSRKQCLIWLFLSLLSLKAQAQLESLSTQYMHSQLMINPAYAGVRNTFSVNLFARHQWMGIDGAPVNYNIGVHSPLNRSKVSLGGSLNSYQAGPVMNNRFGFYYSYLVRLRHNLLLSMGASALVNHYGLFQDDWDVVDEGDPNFTGNGQNSFKPNAGVGFFLYSPSFYLGLSVPQVLSGKFKNSETDQVLSEITRVYYISTGYATPVSEEFFIKPSSLFRYIEGGSYTVDVNIELLYKELLSVGISHRFNQAYAFIAGFRINEKINMYYSYDISTAPSGLGKGSHEITLSFDTDEWLRRNRDRMFKKKKKKKTSEDAGVMRSIRHF